MMALADRLGRLRLLDAALGRLLAGGGGAHAELAVGDVAEELTDRTHFRRSLEGV
jgi:hypothetical protein